MTFPLLVFPGRPSEVVLEVLLVEDELDVGLRVGQTLFLQRFAQLRRTTQEDAHFSPAGRQHFNISSRDNSDETFQVK